MLRLVFINFKNTARLSSLRMFLYIKKRVLHMVARVSKKPHLLTPTPSNRVKEWLIDTYQNDSYNKMSIIVSLVEFFTVKVSKKFDVGEILYPLNFLTPPFANLNPCDNQCGPWTFSEVYLRNCLPYQHFKCCVSLL